MPIFRDRDSGLPSPKDAVDAAEEIVRGIGVESMVAVRQAELVDSYAAKCIETYFGQLVPFDLDKSINKRFRYVGEPRQLARDFRDRFLLYQKHPELLSESLDITVREAKRMRACLTLENLAQHAKERFERAQVEFGRAVPETADAYQHRKNVDFWANASQIVCGAFEAKG